MKKLNKGIITISCALVVATVLGGCGVYGFEFGETKTEKIDKTKVESFSSIDLDVCTAKIELIPTTDEFAVEYSMKNQNVDYNVSGDVLTVESKAIKNVKRTDESYLKIYVPEDSKFVTLDYEGDVGSINIEDFTFDDVNIKTDVSNVKMDDVTINNNITIKTDVGNIDLDLDASDCSYEVSADVADININGTKYNGLEVEKSYTSNVGPQVDIKTDCGKIKLTY